jgi:hypothetical protein
MTKRSVEERLLRDSIVDIGEPLKRQFGCSGKMLNPSRATVETLVGEIPIGTVATTPLLRKELADRHDVQATCPFLTKRALMAIASDPETKAPFWRVVKGGGELMAAYPGGVRDQAERLRSEGVTITATPSTAKVSNLKDCLATFSK